jgi:hypothetical protein
MTVCGKPAGAWAGKDFFQDFLGRDRIPTFYEQQKEPGNG